MIFPFGHDCSCRWMTDFLEKSILLDGLCGTFPNEKAKVKDVCIHLTKLQLHPLL